MTVNVTRLRREALEMRYKNMSLPAKDVLWLCDRVAELEDQLKKAQDLRPSVNNVTSGVG